MSMTTRSTTAGEVPAQRGAAQIEGAEIRPIKLHVTEEDLVELRRRIEATRLPTEERVDDRSQGVQLATMRELARYWSAEYDWRWCEARLYALPQFRTRIDGVDSLFIHVWSPHPDALPLILTHGWPGSDVEMLEFIGPLTDPTAHRERAEDAFPGEIWRSPRSWFELSYRALNYFNEVDRGGHFAAWEEPELFTTEVRAAFRSLRS